ncbi:MAG: hypothetical protein MZV70_39770 [Desulfobacterales bacterium]|nr:hypothetical protein [Desulfobacterales bacterium]
MRSSTPPALPRSTASAPATCRHSPASYNPQTGQGLRRPDLHEGRGGRRRRPRLRHRRERCREGHWPTSCPTSASSRGRTRWPTRTPATRPSSSAWTTPPRARSTSTSGTSRTTAARSSAPACMYGKLYGVKVPVRYTAGRRPRAPMRQRHFELVDLSAYATRQRRGAAGWSRWRRA